MKEITNASEHYSQHMAWVFDDGIPAWERYNVQRVVSMAACIVDGHLIVGNRHFCPIMQMTIENLGIDPEGEMKNGHQGFVDQYGVFMTRKEAWVVAKAAGQIKQVFQEGVLYSECYL
jgi:hypothetical protein